MAQTLIACCIVSVASGIVHLSSALLTVMVYNVLLEFMLGELGSCCQVKQLTNQL